MNQSPDTNRNGQSPVAKSGNVATTNAMTCQWSHYIALGKTNEFSRHRSCHSPRLYEELLTITDAGHMQQDRHAELITLLDIVMIPKRVKLPWMILLSSISRFWAILVENGWHARGRTFRSLFAAKS